MSILLIIPQALYAELPPLMQMPTEEELRQVEELLSTLSPEELEELSKLGEELIRTAEAEGRPLFGPNPAEQAPAPVQPTAPKPTEAKPVPTKPAAPQPESNVPKKQLSQLQKMLSDIVDTLGTIRQKAASEEQLALMLVPINTQLNSLSYYIRTIAYSKHAIRLTDKDFASLKNSLTTLATTLDDLNNQLYVEEIDITLNKKANHKKAMLQQAQITLKNFITTITTACSSQNLLVDLEGFMKKYEPEALELRKKQEAQEKEATGQVKKLPTTNTGTTSPYLPTRPEIQQPNNRPGGPQGQTGVRFGAPTSGPSGLTVKNAAGNSQQGQGGSGGQGGSTGGQKAASKKDGDKKDDKKDDKKEETKDKEPTVDEQAQDIKNRLVSLNRRVQAGQQNIKDFTAYLEESADEAPAVVQRQKAQIIGDLTYEAFRIKKTMEAWATTIGKTAEWTEARAYKDDMQRVVDNSLVDFQNLASTVSAYLDRPDSKTNKRIQSHTEEITDLKKIAADISSVKIKPK